MKRGLLLWLIFAVSTLQALAQTRTVTGKVTDAQSGAALPGVTVQLKGSVIGTVTGIDGNYKINVPEKPGLLIFTFVGYATRELNITGDHLDVTLSTSSKDLGEYVVVGYGSSQRKSLIGAIATVKAAEINQVPMASFDNILQGKATGVQITQRNGRPGQRGFIRIRGTSSINASSEPLIVVDGVPVSLDNYNLLNPNDIENVSILKDAASSSIYGSRGSNGVIIVSTKRGAVNSPKLTYSFQYGVKSKTQDDIKLMNAREKLKYEYDLGISNSYVIPWLRGNGFANTATLFNISDADRQRLWNGLAENETDWIKLLTNKGPFRTHELTLAGGSEKIRYYFTLNSWSEDGIVRGSFFDRKSGRLNIEYNAKDWFKIGNTLNVGYVKENISRERFNVQSAYTAMYRYNAYEPEFNKDGSWNLTHQGLSIGEATINQPEFSSKIMGLGSLFGEFSFFKRLKIRSSLGLNFIDYSREYYVIPGSFLDQFVGDKAAQGSKTDNGYREFNKIWTNTANWIQSINEKHNIDILAGTEFTENNYWGYNIGSKGFPSPIVNTQSNAAVPLTTNTTKYDWALFSLFGRVKYNYQEKYFLESSVRRDGSSRFGGNKKYGTFWAVGAGWDVAKEKFMNIPVLNQLKVRAAVGTSGNAEFGLPTSDGINNYLPLGLYRFISYNAQPASAPKQLANANLTWEKNLNYDLGIDFGLFDNRLTGNIEYYHKTTTDLLFEVPKPAATGYAVRWENIGEMVNKGFEVTLGYDVIRKKNLTWNISANLTTNKNEITKLYGEQDVPVADGLTRLAVGRPVYNFYMNRWKGVNPDNGDAQWYTKDGKVTNQYNGGDAVFVDRKSPLPKYYGSVNTSVSYKGIDLALQFYYSGGNYVFNYMKQNLFNDGALVQSQMDVRAADYWKKPGDNVDNPKPIALGPQTTYISDRFLQSGNYIRLRNVTLGYNVPADILKKARIQNLRVYVSGQNLWTRTKFYGDPEVGIGNAESTGISNTNGVAALFSYPQSKTILFGLNVSF